MILILYPKLCSRSRTAIKRKYKKFGHPYHYSPRGDLLKRLAEEMDWTIDQVYQQLMKERSHLMKGQD